MLSDMDSENQEDDYHTADDMESIGPITTELAEAVIQPS